MSVGPAISVPVAELDTELVAAVVAYGDSVLDPDWSLLREWAEPNPIHTRVRDVHAHRYVPSLYYALALLEVGRTADAETILLRVVADQDTDPGSDTYGLWGYFAEEPVADMVPPDWNQADFNGRSLALALLRHGDALSPPTADALRTALGHAARSVRRRDVHLDYTNIAVKGTFVAAAAGRLLADADLAAYARDRLHAFARRVDRTGTFAEFASPTYWLVAAEGLQAMAEHVGDDVDGDELARVQRRHWEHLAVRWNGALHLLAGPMSRAYDDSTARQPAFSAFLAKALAATAGAPVAGHGSVAVPAVSAPLVWPALLSPRVPVDLLDAFTAPPAPHLHRELVVRRDPAVARELDGGSAVAEQVATSWLTPALSLGSVNSSDTWLQRRTLLGQWTEPGGAAGTVRARVLKDGEDLSAGAFSSVQDRDRVLWAFGLALPGGDAHIHLDMIEPGHPIPARRISAAFDVTGVPGAAWSADDVPLPDGADVGVGALVRVRTDAVTLLLRVAAVSPGARVRRDGDRLEVVLADGGPLVPDGDAVAVGTLRLLASEDPEPLTPAPVVTRGDGVWEAGWSADHDGADLALRVRAGVGTRAEHAAAFAAWVGDEPAPAPRLSDEVLAR